MPYLPRFPENGKAGLFLPRFSAYSKYLSLHYLPGISTGRNIRADMALIQSQDTPSFFCRLVEDVVYWNTTFSPGLTIRLTAWVINAAS